MATVRTTLGAVLAPRAKSATISARAAPPQLLRCLVVSASAHRRRLIRAAAESQAWDAIVCRDAGEFLRAVFKRSVPLVVVDLPEEQSKYYWELREATDWAKRSTSALVLVVGAEPDPAEELWARRLGAWAYLSEANQRGFEVVFDDARRAVSRCEVAPPFVPAGVQEGG